MDPTEALRKLREALAAGELEEAREAFQALDEWLQTGGFLPRDWQVCTTA